MKIEKRFVRTITCILPTQVPWKQTIDCLIFLHSCRDKMFHSMNHFFFIDKMSCLIDHSHEFGYITSPVIQNSIHVLVRTENDNPCRPINASKYSLFRNLKTHKNPWSLKPQGAYIIRNDGNLTAGQLCRAAARFSSPYLANFGFGFLGKNHRTIRTKRHEAQKTQTLSSIAASSKTLFRQVGGSRAPTNSAVFRSVINRKKRAISFPPKERLSERYTIHQKNDQRNRRQKHAVLCSLTSLWSPNPNPLSQFWKRRAGLGILRRYAGS